MRKGIYLEATLQLDELNDLNHSQPVTDKVKQAVEKTLPTQPGQQGINISVKRIRAVKLADQRKPEVQVLFYLEGELEPATPFEPIATNALKPFLKSALTDLRPTITSIIENTNAVDELADEEDAVAANTADTAADRPSSASSTTSSTEELPPSAGTAKGLSDKESLA